MEVNVQQAKFVGDAEEQEEEDRLKVLRGKVARKKKALQLQKELTLQHRHQHQLRLQLHLQCSLWLLHWLPSQ